MPPKVSVSRDTMKGKKTSTGGGPRSDEESQGILEGISSLHSWIKTQTMIRPTKLNAKKDGSLGFDEEDEDVVISLTSADPNHSKSKVRWSHTTRSFMPVTMVETLIDHLDIESRVLHKESAEAKEQIKLYGEPKFILDWEQEKKKRKKKKIDSEEEEEEQVEHVPSSLANQFKNIERATQTLNTGITHAEMQTDPPPRSNFCETVNQWVIYEQYDMYEKMREKEEDAEKMKKNADNKTEKRKLYSDTVKVMEDPRVCEIQRKMLVSAKVLERMVNLNTFDDIAQDFRFWDDACDEFKENEGTLLPLWKFWFEKANELEVTALCWNFRYTDLFAAGFGSYDFYNQNISGYICLFSLKNPSYPEFVCEADVGVMCVDIHPQHPHMVVAGLYDGNVAVYNLQTKQGKPSYLSHPHNGKHKEVVWQVKWVKDNLDGYLNFYSVAGDGRVTNWTIVKTKLWFNDELTINFSKGLVNSDNSSNQLMDSGRALTFKPDDETLFLVGTEEGIVHLATTQYSSQFLMTYPAHSTPINNLHWNPYLPEIFLTCASEFVVKIFHRKSTKPILRFDVGSQVGDCSWSPYSSTVFGVVSQEGKVIVYDLDVDQYNPICTQAIVPRRRARLNHISFNPTEPLIIVGDSCGHIHSLKLSPNLRRMNKETQQAILNKEPNLVKAAEIRKLEKLLEQVVTTPVLESDSGDENQD